MADIAVDIVGAPLHVGPDGGLHVGVLVLVHLEGDHCHGWTERVVGHGDVHVLGAGLPVWRSDGQLGWFLVQLNGALVQLDLVCVGRDSCGCALVETDPGRAIVLVGLGAVLAGEVP